MKDVMKDLDPVCEMMEAQRDVLTARGYVVEVTPHGVDKMGGHQGVRLAASRDSGSFSLSVEIDIDAMKHVTILVDNKLRDGSTPFPRPGDLNDKMRQMIAWFVNTHVPE